MRYIDRSNCKSIHDKGVDSDIQKLGKLTRTATKIAESKKLGVLKLSHDGGYRVIRESGLGAYMDTFADLAKVDSFLKQIRA